MPQVNLRTTDQFERDLFEVMSAMRIANKTSAIRFAIHEMAEALRTSEGRRAQTADQ
jgi:hypothetical protein